MPYRKIARKCKVSKSTVLKYIKKYCLGQLCLPLTNSNRKQKLEYQYFSSSQRNPILPQLDPHHDYHPRQDSTYLGQPYSELNQDNQQMKQETEKEEERRQSDKEFRQSLYQLIQEYSKVQEQNYQKKKQQARSLIQQIEENKRKSDFDQFMKNCEYHNKCISEIRNYRGEKVNRTDDDKTINNVVIKAKNKENVNDNLICPTKQEKHIKSTFTSLKSVQKETTIESKNWTPIIMGLIQGGVPTLFKIFKFHLELEKNPPKTLIEYLKRYSKYFNN